MLTINLLGTQHWVSLLVGNWITAFEETKKYFDQYDDIELEVEESDFNKVAWKTFYEDGIDPVIFISDTLSLKEQIPVVAHEATHAIHFIFDYFNIERSDEVFAILVDEIVEQFIKNFVKVIY